MSDDSFQQMGDFLNVAKSREIIARLNSTKQPASVSTKSESTQNVSEVERYLVCKENYPFLNLVKLIKLNSIYTVIDFSKTLQPVFNNHTLSNVCIKTINSLSKLLHLLFVSIIIQTVVYLLYKLA